MPAERVAESLEWRVFRGTIANTVAKVLALGVGFVLVPLMLRTLGPEQFGLWVFVGSLVEYGALLDVGVSVALVQSIAVSRRKKDGDEVGSLIAGALMLYAAFGVAVGALTLVAMWLVPRALTVTPDLRAVAPTLIALRGAGLAVTLPCATSLGVLRGFQRYDLAGQLIAVGTLATALGMVLALALGWGILGLAVVVGSVPVLMQVVHVLVLRRVQPGLRLNWRGARWRVLRGLLSFGSSSALIGLAGRLQTRTDEIVIGAFLPVQAVGPYSVARRLSDVAPMAGGEFAKVILPVASDLHGAGEVARLRAVYLRSTRLVLAAFLPVGIALCLLAGRVLSAWLAPAFGAYGDIVVILTVAAGFDMSLWPAGAVLQAMGRHRPVALMALGTALANLALSLVLVRPLGLRGVALGTLIPSVVECLLLVMPFALRMLGVPVLAVLGEVIWPLTLAAAACTAVIATLTWACSPVSLVALGGVGMLGGLAFATVYLSTGAAVVERGMCLALVSGGVRRVRIWMTR